MLSFAIMGCGRIAPRHLDAIVNHLPGGRLAAVCDIDRDRAANFGLQYSCPAYTSIDELLVREQIDVISVLTPSGLHANHVVHLASYGKHLIVEKPMCLTLSEADRMISACDQNNIKLFVVKQNRFNLPIRQARLAIEANALGRITLGTVRVRWSRSQQYYAQDSWRGTWRFDGGCLTNQASHHIDMLQWMLGDVSEVSCYARTAVHDIEVEDTAVAILKFTSGALGIIEATTAARPADLEGSLSILGDHGSIVVGGFAMNKIETWNFVEPSDFNGLNLEDFSENPKDVYGYGHIKYYQHVAESITNNGPNLIDGISGRKTVEIINALYESFESGHPVKLRFNPTFVKLGLPL